MSAGTKRSRGTSPMAASTRSSSIPRRRSCRSTMRARLRAKGSSVDVVPEPFRLMDGHLPPSQRHHARALERRQEAAGALPRRAGQVSDLGLGRLDEDVLLRRALGLTGHGLGQQRTGHPPGHGLERLLEQALGGAADAFGQRRQELAGDVGVVLDLALEVRGQEGHGRGVLDGFRGGRARLAPEHRQLAEHAARPQLRQGDRAAVLVLAREDHRAVFDEVTRVALVALVEDHLVPLPGAGNGGLGDLVELALGEVREHLGPRKERCRLLPSWHWRIILHGMAVAGPTVTERDVEDAAALLDGRVRETPLLAAGELSRHLGARTLLKAENLQLTGSFKVRGALNTVARLSPDELECGVVAASAGNHAQAVAWAARGAGASAKLVMPEGAPLAKVAAVREYDGDVHLVEGGYDAAGAEARRLAEEEGRTLIHAFDRASIVAGQGTVGLEIARQDPPAPLVFVPLGGGGLSSGIAIALAGRAKVVGVQAEERAGATICDDEVAEAMVLLLERSKLVVEGAGAVGVAALMHGRVEPPAEGSVCAVLSGGNVDASLLSECIRMGETAAGRRMVIGTVVPDRPGALAGLLRLVAEHGANVVDVEHLRDGIELHVRETAIKLVLQTRGHAHGREIVEAAREQGFSVAVEREVV